MEGEREEGGGGGKRQPNHDCYTISDRKGNVRGGSEEKRGGFFSRRHLALVKRGGVERPAFAVCFDWADGGSRFVVLLFCFDSARLIN